MLFNSIDFALFLPIVFVLYWFVFNKNIKIQNMNKKDLAELQSIFGIRKVYDFSGINEITNDYRNYYEDSHYIPHVADTYLEIIYNENE